MPFLLGVVNFRLSQGPARLEDELLAQGELLSEGCPTETRLSPMHADKTPSMRSRADGMLEGQIGSLSRTRIG